MGGSSVVFFCIEKYLLSTHTCHLAPLHAHLPTESTVAAPPQTPDHPLPPLFAHSLERAINLLELVDLLHKVVRVLPDRRLPGDVRDLSLHVKVNIRRRLPCAGERGAACRRVRQLVRLVLDALEVLAEGGLVRLGERGELRQADCGVQLEV